jgi:squalene-associated FAD-dependent desaturase
MSRTAVVVGGGLAGLAASLALLDAGWTPILLESRRRLGGRASSFHDPQTGHSLDNCQHVLMGCCTNLLDLYTRLGVDHMIRWHDTTWWARPGGGVDRMHIGRLPAPLHQAIGFGRMKLLPLRDRLSVAKGMRGILRIGPSNRSAWQSRTGTELLDHLGQTATARRLFWDPVIVSALNVSAGEVAASHVLHVMQEGFLAGRMHATMGVPEVPLESLYESAIQSIEDGGGEVRLGVKAAGIGVEARRVIGVEAVGGFQRADAVVMALPWEKLDAMLTDRQRTIDRRLGRLGALGHSPILGVHLLLDRQVLRTPHLVLPGFDTHWLFDKGRTEDGGQHLHAVISAADQWMDRSEDDIVSRVFRDVQSVCPDAADAVVLHARPVKERRATFRATPEAEQARPAAGPNPVGRDGGDLEGLYLAGDYCQSGWPATMEGAVRSGYLAASAITGQDVLVDDLPVGRLVSMLSG